jgi:hypothetical protein
MISKFGKMDLPVFAPNNTLGTNSSGIGSFGVKIPSKVICPPIRVAARDFISVPAPPVSMT